MKSILVILLIVAVLPLGLFAEEERLDPEESKLRGEMAAKRLHAATCWGTLGFAGGLILGILGAEGVVATAALSNPDPRIMPDENEVDIACYLEGYRGEAKRINIRGAALCGGLGIFFHAALHGTPAFYLIIKR